MVEEISDMVGEIVVPYLIHFGEKGITPRVLSIQAMSILTLEKAEGPRLGELLERDTDLSQLSEIYKKLGYSVGYISKYCIAHTDLHVYNVVVENNRPVIIDWEKAVHVGVISSNPKEQFSLWMRTNGDDLLDSTEEKLKEKGKIEMYSTLERVFTENFLKELAVPAEITVRSIFREATDLYGF